MSANGGTDAAGGTNRDRSFDFNTFASELFNSITIRKTSAAEIEEGSLGATVDLRSGAPVRLRRLHRRHQRAGQLQRHQRGRRSARRVPDQQHVRRRQVRRAAVGGVHRSASCSTKARARCAGRTRSTPTARATRRAEFGPLEPGYTGRPTLAQLNAAFRPRIPRYDIYEHEQERLGITGSLQWQVARRHAAQPRRACTPSSTPSAARSSSKRRCSAPTARRRSSNVDVRRCGDRLHQHDRVRRVRRRRHPLRSALRRAARPTSRTSRSTATHSFSDTLRVHGLVGYSEAEHDNPVQTTLLFDRADVDGYSYDFRGNSRLPVITYGNVDVTDPATWTLSQIRLRPQSSDEHLPDRVVRRRLGCDRRDHAEGRSAVQEVRVRHRVAGSAPTARRPTRKAIDSRRTSPRRRSRATASSCSISSNLEQPAGSRTTLADSGHRRGRVAVQSVRPLVFPLGIEPALSNNYTIEEEDLGGLRAGRLQDRSRRVARCAATSACATSRPTQTSSGYTFTSGAPLLTTVERTYNDTLPSLNVALDVTDSFIIRAAAPRSWRVRTAAVRRRVSAFSPRARR